MRTTRYDTLMIQFPIVSNSQVAMVVRALLLKKLDIKKYKAVLALESHKKEREEMGKTEVKLVFSLSSSIQMFTYRL